MLDCVFFLYVLTNKNQCWDQIFCITQHVVVLPIMDMESAKSGANGWGFFFFATLYQNVTKKMFKKHTDPIYFGADQRFYVCKKKNLVNYVMPDMITVSSFLTLDLSDQLIVQYKLHTNSKMYIEAGANTLKSSSTFQFPTKILFSKKKTFFTDKM